MRQFVIGVDNGGTFIKAAIYDDAGRQVGLAREPGSVINDVPGQVERDQEQLWCANCVCIRNAIRESGINPTSIQSIGFAGQGKGVYMVDADGQTFRNAITSSDARSWRYVERWKKDGTADKVFSKTFQVVSEGQPVSILAWMRSNELEVYNRIRWVFSMKDFLVYRMTGEAVADYCNQSGSNYLNLAANAYDPDILSLFGIPEVGSKLPPMRNAAEICGVVSETAALATGLAPGTKVVTGMFDVGATAVAAGLINEDRLCIITGTHGVNVYIAPQPVKNGSIMHNSLYCVPGYYLIEEGLSTSAGTLEWVVQIMYKEDLRRAEASGSSLYPELDAIVAGIEPEANGVVFLPFINGSRDNVFGKGAWLGMSAADGRERMLAAVYEGVALAHRLQVERLLTNRLRPEAIRMAGGAVNSDVWVQIFADVLNMPIETIEGKELGACGAAMAAGIAAGFYHDFAEAVSRLAKVKRTVLPRPAKVGVYETKFRKFAESMRLTDPIWSNR